MLGWALVTGTFKPEDGALWSKYTEPHDRTYVAYLREKASGNAVKMNLTNNFAESDKIFKSLFKDAVNAKYSAGVIGHTKNPGFWTKHTELVGGQLYFDVYNVVAEYCQKELKLYMNQGNNEKAANVTTRAEIEAKWKAEKLAITSLFTGKGDTLLKNHHSFITTFDPSNNKFALPYQKASKNLKQHFNGIADWMFKHVIKPNKNLVTLAGLREARTVLHCSAGELTEQMCQRLIGYSVIANYFHESAKEEWINFDRKKLWDA